MVVALRTRDGAQIWSYLTQGYIDSLTVTEGVETARAGIVYAASRDKSLYALRASDGRLLWKYQAGDYILASVAVQGGSTLDPQMGMSPCWNAMSGRVQQHICVDSGPCPTTFATAWSIPVVSGQTIYLGVTIADRGHPHPASELPGAVYALDADTGRIRWQYQSGIVGGAVGTPALVSG